MKDEPEIVKEMRESENLDKLSSKSEGTSQETFHELDGDAKVLENNLEKDEENFEFGKEVDSVCCENEELYRKLVENSSEGILIIDFKSKVHLLGTPRTECGILADPFRGNLGLHGLKGLYNVIV